MGDPNIKEVLDGIQCMRQQKEEEKSVIEANIKVLMNALEIEGEISPSRINPDGIMQNLHQIQEMDEPIRTQVTQLYQLSLQYKEVNDQLQQYDQIQT